MNNKIKIVIVGGGFGGVYTAKYLGKLFSKKVEITLINKNDYFLFTPLLHEVATGSLSENSIIENYNHIFKNSSNIKYIKDSVLEIDSIKKIVLTKDTIYDYDFLVIATGAETNFFNIEGAKENCFTLKNIDDALRIRDYIANNKNVFSCTIIGGGATGVELAGELSECNVNVNIITNTPDLIPQFPVKMRNIALNALKNKGVNVKTNATVNKISEKTIYFTDNTQMQSDMIIWVAGVKPSISNIKGLQIGPKGRIEINEYLQSMNDKFVFAIGDSAGNLPMLAQIAVQQSETIVKNICFICTGKNMIPFKTNIKGLLLSIGKWYAIGDIKGITIKGPVMWWLWRTIYLFNFHSWPKRIQIACEWTINLFSSRTFIK